LFVSDELGLLKVVESPSLTDWDGCKVVKRWGEPNRSDGIRSLCLLASDDPQVPAVLAASRGKAGLEARDATTGVLLGRAACSREGAGVTAVAAFRQGESGDPTILSGDCEGQVTVHCVRQDRTGEEDGEVSALETRASWEAGRPCECLAVLGGPGLVASGGEGRELSVWDIESQERVFRAKGAKQNFLGLQDKPWVTSVAWLPDEEGRKVVVGTGFSKLRLYDLSAGHRRPVLEVAMSERTRVTSVSPLGSGRVWASNGEGKVQEWDLAANRLGGILRGPGGAVRSIAASPDGSLLASVGLDRWLRVHQTATRKQVAKLYLKQQLTGVAWAPLVGRADGGGAGAAAAETPVGAKRAAEGAAGGAKRGKP